MLVFVALSQSAARQGTVLSFSLSPPNNAVLADACHAAHKLQRAWALLWGRVSSDGTMDLPRAQRLQVA